MFKHLIQLQKVPLNGRIWQPGSDQLKWDSMCPQSVLGENSVRSRYFDWSMAIERYKEEQSPHWQRKITQRGFLTVLIYLLDSLILDGQGKGHVTEMKNKDFMLLNPISQKTEPSCLTQFKESCSGGWLISMTYGLSSLILSEFLEIPLGLSFILKWMFFFHWGWTFE